MEKTLSSQTLRMAVAALNKMGVATDRILTESRISKMKLRNPLSRFPVSNEEVFWKAVVANTGDPMIAIHMAEHVPFGTYPLLDYLGASCQTLYQALVFFMKYAGIVYGPWHPTLTEKKGVTQFSLGGIGNFEAHKHAAEFGLSLLCMRLSLFSRSRLPLIKVHFQHKAQGPVKAYENVFGAPVVFEQATDSLFFGAAIKKISCQNPDQFLLGSLLLITEKVFRILTGQDGNSESPLIETVKHAVKSYLPEGEPKIGAVAKKLAMSTRTLQRKLELEDSSLSQIITQVRKEMVPNLLKDKNLTHEDVAMMLGYSTLSAFNRAFKHWFNMTPSKYKSSRIEP